MSSERSSSVQTVVGGRALTLSRLDKVYYPDSGFTKGQVVDYYARIAPVMLPHIRDRPLTMKRYPDGVAGQSFFEKHLPRHAPPWVRHVAVPGAGGSDPVEYGVICDLATLVWAANLGAIELHVPLWRVGRRRSLPAAPDHIVFDLDPGEGATIVDCAVVARLIARLAEKGDPAFVAKTSGSKGLQLYAPVGARAGWEATRARARDIAGRLEASHPDLVVSNMRRNLRHGKVLIDWSQNNPAKTTVAAYSLRARPDPTVSTPVTWEEVEHCADSRDPDELRFTTDQVLERVARHGDLFAGLVR